MAENEVLDHDEHGHGDPDPEIRPSIIFKIIAALVVTAIGFGLLMIPLVAGLRSMAENRVVATDVDDSRPAGPRLQADPELDYDLFFEAEQHVLDSYGWTDRGAQLARIPVDRAKDLVLQQGVGPVSPAAVMPNEADSPEDGAAVDGGEAAN